MAFNPGGFVRQPDSETGVPSAVKAACADLPVVEVHYTNALVTGCVGRPLAQSALSVLRVPPCAKVATAGAG